MQQLGFSVIHTRHGLNTVTTTVRFELVLVKWRNVAGSILQNSCHLAVK